MNRTIFIVAICFLELLTSMLLFISPAPMNVTAISTLAKVFGENRFVLSAIYAVAPALALYREFATEKTGRSVFWYLPQMFLVMTAGIGAILCITQGMYADGIARPIPFIMRDQAIYPILVVLYFISISRH